MLSWELISPEEAIHFAKRRDSPFNAHLFLPLFVGFDSLILKVIKTVTILESVWGGLLFRLSEEQNISLELFVFKSSPTGPGLFLHQHLDLLIPLGILHPSLRAGDRETQQAPRRPTINARKQRKAVRALSGQLFFHTTAVQTTPL